MSEFAQVHSRLSVVLRTFQPVEGPLSTVSHFEKDRFTLKPGLNQVPVEFMDDWMKANSDHPFVKDNYIQMEKNDAHSS